MTEAEWLTCNLEPDKMLTYLQRRRKVNRPSERKRRLFFVACCRRLLIESIPKPRGLERILRRCEEFAEGSIGVKELRASASNLLLQCLGTNEDKVEEIRALWAGVEAVEGKFIGPEVTEIPLGHGMIWRRDGAWMMLPPWELQARCVLLRDIVGNPFRPVNIKPFWLTWNDGLVPKIAQPIYKERTFDHLPILADALEEAGCTDADILNHCRQPGEHVRGCWVVDLLLGKS